ncbi:MAG: hypothetical protein ABIR39_02745 [Nocardioides sp.]|uniref:DUF445 domain-containing protein n=1 Tax=Nocardioides sp. TaxID=35761 RepID=UPI003262FCCD
MADLWEWLLQVDWTLQRIDAPREWLAFLSIPLFTAAVGWFINLTGLWMLFSPVHFHGVKIRGLSDLARRAPRKVQEIPGLLNGGIGWQGIVPARAAKMGSIAVDKAIAKIGTPSDFYQHLQPDTIAEHIVTIFAPELPELVDTVMRREHPTLWRDLPAAGRRRIVARVQSQLPSVARTVTDQIGEHIDQLLDPKLMVINHFRENPELAVRLFRDIGAHELRRMVHFGAFFGFLLGIPVAFADHWFHQSWLLPVLGILVGWITNKLGMWLIFEPLVPTRILGVRFHGLFLRRQDEAAEIYARLIADEVITLERIGDFLLGGPGGDRTRQMLAAALGPAIDQAAGPLRVAARIAIGRRAYDNIKESFAEEAVLQTVRPFRDPEFSRQQSVRIQEMFSTRTKALASDEFVEMMRSAFKEDEWMLYAHGAIMGFVGGLVHLGIFGVGGG